MQLVPRACARPLRLVLQRHRILCAPQRPAACRVHSVQAASTMQVPSNTDVAIVGAGLTGAIVARELQAAGARVQVFDMGGGPGGRASSRKLRPPSGTAPSPVETLVDHGLQALPTPMHPEVAQVLQSWVEAGLVAEWSNSDRIGWLDAPSGAFSARSKAKGEGQPDEGRGGSFFGLLDQPGPLYVGTPSMSAVISHELSRSSDNPITVHQRTRIESAQLERTPISPAVEDSSSGAAVAAQGKWRLRGRSTARPSSQQQAQQQQPASAPTNETVDLGSFHALVLTDSLAGKAGSPGHIHIDASACTATAAEISHAMGRVATMPRRPLFAVWATFPAENNGTGGGEESAQGGKQRQEGQRQRQQQGLLPFDAACVQGSAGIGWIAMDSSKPGRTAAAADNQTETLVAFTTPEFAAELLGVPVDSPFPNFPPQTPQYLEERAERVWKILEQDLCRARGGRGVGTPLSLTAMRWGSAFATSPLVFENNPCMTAKTDVVGGSQLQQQQQEQHEHTGTPAMFVMAGDYCTTETSKGGFAAAVLSGLSAARALVQGLQV